MQNNGEAPAYERRYVLFFALFCAFAAILPSLYAGLVAAPAGSQYLGTEWATDDYMVYSAWTRQAMAGAFLFDNRFTTADQPGLTIHLYFLAVGQIARFTGVAFAFGLARFLLSGLFVWLTYRFIRRLTQDTYTIKLALTFSVFGAGVGYLVWHRFGEAIVLPKPELLKGLMLGRLPTDVWQPEGFAFPSMLTTGLFVAALCLIVFVFGCFLDARTSSRAVLPGAVAMLVLMNIHSYDVLLVALVMAAFLAMSIARRHVSGRWVLRSVGIAAGALPAALWFTYVLRSDPVFQARAATLTYSPNFRQFFFGYLILLVLGLIYVAVSSRPDEDSDKSGRPAWLPAGLLGLLFVGMFVAASGHENEYWLQLPAWLVLYGVAVGFLVVAARASEAFNLVLAWAVVGLVAPYFPGLFQRKLAMGLAVPWAVLAALGLAHFMLRLERGQRNLVSILAILVVCGSAPLWFQRDLGYVKSNVSRTAVHPVFLSSDTARIIQALDRIPGRKTVLAMPGLSAWPVADQAVIIVPDLNPIASGMTGAYTYAGHWSETPNYDQARSELTSFFLASTSPADRETLMATSRANYVIAPVQETFPAELGLADLRYLGPTVVDGHRFRLIRVEK